jgi:hypothetical protein
MPTLNYSLAPDGLRVPCMVNLAGGDLLDLLAKGGAPPRAIHARGMIDTGSTLTAVAMRVLQALGATQQGSAQTHTAAGVVTVQVFMISFTIHAGPGSPTLHRPDWLVTGLAQDIADVDVLFGVDLLREIVLTVDGPSGSFRVDF